MITFISFLAYYLVGLLITGLYLSRRSGPIYWLDLIVLAAIWPAALGVVLFEYSSDLQDKHPSDIGPLLRKVFGGGAK